MSEDIVPNETAVTKTPLLKSMLTVSDNETLCITRVLGFLAGLAALGFQAFIVIHTGMFDILQFSTGYGVLLGSIAGSVKLKDSAEPQG